MNSTFSGCASVTQFPAGFVIPSTVINLYCAFRGMTSLLEIPYSIWPSSWSSSNINIGLMFYRDADQGTIPTGTINSELWTTFASSFTNIDRVFRNCSALTNYADIPTEWK